MVIWYCLWYGPYIPVSIVPHFLCYIVFFTWPLQHCPHNLIPTIRFLWCSLCNMILMTRSSLCGLNELAPMMQPPWHSPHHVVSTTRPWRFSLHGAVHQNPGLYDNAPIKWSQLHVCPWPGPHNDSYDSLPIVKPLWSSPHYTMLLTQRPWPGPHNPVPKCKVLTTQFFWHNLYTEVLPITQLYHILYNILPKIESPQCSPMMCSCRTWSSQCSLCEVASMNSSLWPSSGSMAHIAWISWHNPHHMVSVKRSPSHASHRVVNKVEGILETNKTNTTPLHVQFFAVPLMECRHILR